MSFAVKGFWALRGIIMDAMVMLSKDTFNFYMWLCGNNAQKQKTVHSSMTCLVLVLPYKAGEQMSTC
jgi:hypothetical protein